MSTTLVQIISKQTMPNLLAAMAVKPERVVHICTPSMRKASTSLAQAYREAGVKAEVVEVPVGARPLLQEMFSSVSAVAREQTGVIVNFTGGTKLMSIGAYGAATAARVPSFYVDTELGRFVDGATLPGLVNYFPRADLTIAQVNKQLTVNAITKANGVERVTGGKKWKPYEALADLLLRDEQLEKKCHGYVASLFDKEPQDWAKKKEYWLKRRSQPIALPKDICCLAATAGLFEEKHGAFYAARCCCDKFEDLAWPFVFFNGNWWEIAVMRYYAETGKMRDLRWSVDAGSRSGGSTDMEEDILGVDGVNLLYVSCKRGGAKSRLSRTLEDVNSSALRLGGDFAHKVIAVYEDITGKNRQAIINRCKELHMQLLTRHEVMSVPAL